MRLPLLARLNWYWILQALGWTIFILMQLMFNAVAGVTARVVAIATWAGVVGLLSSHAWRRQIKRRGWLGARPRWGTLAPALLALACLQTLSVALGYLILQPQGPVKNLNWLPGSIFYWMLVDAVWTIIYNSVLSLRRANRFEAEALRLEISAKDAELRALQAQVNPHFFFNSMNSVRALVYENQDAAARMIDQLASVMRYALQSGQHDTVPLAAEMEAVQSYLEIEKIRFEERLRVSIEIGVGLDQVHIPPMSLQTLVENAVKYGVEASATGSEIRIRAYRQDGLIYIEIANLGAIVPYTNSTRVGLVNARKRLALALGQQASLDLSENSGWVRATMTLPEAA